MIKAMIRFGFSASQKIDNFLNI